jgi:hypothetical protein
MMRFHKAALAIFVALNCVSCEKETERIPGDPLPPVSIVPAISIGSMEVNYTAFDDIVIPVNYIDGDGDIGFSNADSSVVFVTDNRADIEFQFHVPPLAPDGSQVAIQGLLNVVMENVPLLGTEGDAETTTFTVRIVDRAGNASNEATTPTITINP